MKREILFRGFHPDENGPQEITLDGKKIKGKWVQGDFVRPCNIVFETIGDDPALGQTNVTIYNDYDVIHETVGQYIGIEDRNKKKIFDGDILRYGDLIDYRCFQESIDHPEEYDGNIMTEGIYTATVVWCGNHDYPAFDLDDHDFECNGLSELCSGAYIFEVIGNVFSNPELIDGEVEDDD